MYLIIAVLLFAAAFIAPSPVSEIMLVLCIIAFIGWVAMVVIQERRSQSR